jgi:fumigallin biosynthesis monooxygenase-like protein
MAKVFPGRYAAKMEGPFVVFIIGFRVNRLFAFGKWVPVAKAMGPMIEELMADRSLGFMHAEVSVAWRSVRIVQYWRSFEDLHAYASARNAAHLPAWAAFNRSVGSDGTVGIWHETYAVPAGGYECIYANMPRFGLAMAGEHVPAVGRMETAKSRMGQESSVS